MSRSILRYRLYFCNEDIEANKDGHKKTLRMIAREHKLTEAQMWNYRRRIKNGGYKTEMMELI